MTYMYTQVRLKQQPQWKALAAANHKEEFNLWQPKKKPAMIRLANVNKKVFDKESIKLQNRLKLL